MRFRADGPAISIAWVIGLVITHEMSRPLLACPAVAKF